MAGSQGKAAADGAAGGDAGAPAQQPGGRKKLLLLALPLLLLGGGAGAYFAGLLPFGRAAATAETAAAAPEAAVAAPPVFVTMPEILANLNAPGRRTSFIRVRSQVEVAGPQDAAALQAAMPRIVDLFTVYLREVRPEELRGSAGTHRLREELIARANVAAHPARVTDVLFTEIIVQ
ncbi:MAG: flagellar basal body-associated FliL family protein [Acetobacteraceae bacterium]|nr:flagellar basal body-associated FliL family protein [Acetobacteraceae bacterium]